MKFDFYNSCADSYDELYGEEQYNKYSLVKKYLLGHIIDVGCGSGLLLSYLSNIKANFDYTGIDPSENLISFAKKRAAKLGVDANFYVSSAETFNYGNYDALVSFTSMHHFVEFDFLSNINASIFIFSLLKRSKRFDEMSDFILGRFEIIDVFEENHDIIYVSNKK